MTATVVESHRHLNYTPLCMHFSPAAHPAPLAPICPHLLLQEQRTPTQKLLCVARNLDPRNMPAFKYLVLYI